MMRLEKGTKNTQLNALTLLDSCIMNCGSSFHKVVATPEFVKESRSILAKVSGHILILDFSDVYNSTFIHCSCPIG